MANNNFGFEFNEVQLTDNNNNIISVDIDSELFGEENQDDPKPEEPKKSSKEKPKEEPPVETEPIKLDEESDLDILNDDDIEPITSENIEVQPEEDTREQQIVNLVNNYYDLGIFTGERDENEVIKTDEQLLAKFEEEKRKGANEYLHDFLSRKGQSYYEAFQKIFVEGVDPKVYYTAQTPLEDLSNLDLEKEENQIKVVKKYYTDVLGYAPDVADRRIKTIQDAGDLEPEVSFAFDKIQAQTKQKIEEEAQKAALEERRKLANQQEYENQVRLSLQEDVKDNTFSGFKVDQKILSSTYQNLVAPAWQLPTGEKISDFKKFLIDLEKPQNAKIAILIDILRQNNFDLSSIQQKKENAQKSKIFDALVTKQTTEKRKSPVNNTITSKNFI